ncbi:MAG: alpha/beta family hydrolase [Candidatus Nanopelagicales bacterium]
MDPVVVPTPVGDARVHVVRASRPRALVVLGHGAGRGTDTADLLGLARDLPGERVSVALVDQPWVLAGRKVATAPPTLDRAWVAVLEGIRPLAGASARLPIVVGGRSAGARVACRTAGEVGAAAVLLLAFPLVPPAARADADKHAAALQKRRPELTAPSRLGLPTVVAQGERDTFGTPAELRDLLRRVPGASVVAVPGADHSLRSTAADPAPLLLEAALRAVAGARGE